MNRKNSRAASSRRGKSGREKSRKRSSIRYQLKAAYDGNQRIYTVVDISASSTLDDLCSMILDAFDFTHEHLYLFNFDGIGYGEGDRVYYFMPEPGEKGTDVRLEELNLTLKQKFYFLYDFGDDWGFRIQVQKIYETEEHVINGIVSVKGELEQYPEWAEDDELEEWEEDDEFDCLDEEEWNELMSMFDEEELEALRNMNVEDMDETELEQLITGIINSKLEELQEEIIGFRISPGLTVREVLDTVEDDDVRTYAAVFLGNEESSDCLMEKDIDWVRDQYARALLQDREHMLLFLKDTTAELLQFLMTAKPDPESNILDWEDMRINMPMEEELYSQELSLSLMHLYSMGVCMPEMDDKGKIHSFLISQEMRDSYEKWFKRPATGKKLDMYKELQEIANVLLLRYGMIEIDKLREIYQDVMHKTIKKEDFEVLVNGRLVYFGRYNIYISEEDVFYVSAFDEITSRNILYERTQYPDLTYRHFGLNELESYIENGPYWDVEGYDEFMNAIWKSVQDIQALGMILRSFTDLGILGASADDIIKEIRSELNSSGKRMTKKLQGLIQNAAKNMPLAARYGHKATEQAN